MSESRRTRGDQGESGSASSAAPGWAALVTAIVMTAIAVTGVVFGLTQFQVGSSLDRSRGPFIVVVVIALIGLPTALMWFNVGRILRGQQSAGWRVLKESRLAGAAMAMVGLHMMLGFGQLLVVPVLVGMLAAVGVCNAVLKRVLLRDRVEQPRLNWHDRQQRAFLWRAAPWRFYRRVADDPKVAHQAENFAAIAFTIREPGGEAFPTTLTAIAEARETSVGAAADLLTDLEEAGQLRWDANQQCAEVVGAPSQPTGR